MKKYLRLTIFYILTLCVYASDGFEVEFVNFGYYQRDPALMEEFVPKKFTAGDMVILFFHPFEAPTAIQLINGNNNEIKIIIIEGSLKKDASSLSDRGPNKTKSINVRMEELYLSKNALIKALQKPTYVEKRHKILDAGVIHLMLAGPSGFEVLQTSAGTKTFDMVSGYHSLFVEMLLQEGVSPQSFSKRFREFEKKFKE